MDVLDLGPIRTSIYRCQTVERWLGRLELGHRIPTASQPCPSMSTVSHGTMTEIIDGQRP
jgi:hypothetical protein